MQASMSESGTGARYERLAPSDCTRTAGPWDRRIWDGNLRLCHRPDMNSVATGGSSHFRWWQECACDAVEYRYLASVLTAEPAERKNHE